MLGTFLNGTAILIGSMAGLLSGKELPVSTQRLIKVVLGVWIVYVGLNTSWKALNGGVGAMLKQLVIVVLALSLGNLTGKRLRLQRSLNKLGRRASERFSQASPDSPKRTSDGFVTAAVVFCVSPMAVLGALADGLQGDFRTLALKAVMDGLAALGFVRALGWGVLLSVIPLVAYQGTLSLLGRLVAPFLAAHELMDAVNTTAGLLIFCVSLIVLELKKIELADYLPSLLYAPLITWLWR